MLPKGEAQPCSAETRSLAPGQRERPPISGAIPGFFGVLRRVLRERRKPRDEVAVLGGCSERVSAAKFPDNRENTGNSGEMPLPGRLNTLESDVFLA